ncbi:hypothetical protein FisN_8Hh303 [Fistulifera solaris]|uniref:Non-canonical E2 ubiquitin-conjugating enzyme C-terminal domain-containing protein n=1 Tax=Fistulifera solaris TaxID=1519565 RepID=A0A1Z5KHJ8_FISSO|nr:hypothetical protein FisN_8Hh303 [Fistulifera solaris]|eukprot:GAX25794.1 hypothetical protein FisN_8Hh303 [Fistulifera solaris]
MVFLGPLRKGTNTTPKSDLSELAQWVPLRLTPSERALLTVLEQTLHVSEYTDNVDIASRRGAGIKTQRILEGILEACHIATGLVAASGQEPSLGTSLQDNNIKIKKKKKHIKLKANHKKQKKTLSGSRGDPSENALWLQTMFEIGRRHKVLNPASMRSTYGKLMYLMQDSQNATVSKSLGFSLYKPLQLVGPYLQQHGCEDLLHDPRLECAVQFIADRDPETGEKYEREYIQTLVQGKQHVLEQLVEAYQDKMPADDLRRAIESLADAMAYIESNVAPVQRMLKYLEDNFDPTSPQKAFSLALTANSRYSAINNNYSRYGFSAYSGGSREGPTLTHSHSEQYMFVWQSLRLWCKVMRNMHRLWVCADDDLLSTRTSYHLYNTGQGLQRVQSCPTVRQVMSQLLAQTQHEANAPWVGLSVIHLGDRDVPNALVFIDKYTQIPRFLSPMVHFLQSLSDDHDERIEAYIQDQFGSKDQLKMLVLTDYFKHGFDGSGDDGGSCIDGRLTSSWNWTSRLTKKSYYHAFMLSGFQGFDGDFR